MISAFSFCSLMKMARSAYLWEEIGYGKNEANYGIKRADKG